MTEAYWVVLSGWYRERHSKIVSTDIWSRNGRVASSGWSRWFSSEHRVYTSHTLHQQNEQNKLTDTDEHFQQQVNAIHQSGTLGEKGRLRTLFDYLVANRCEAVISEQVLAADVFGRQDFSTGKDDASVRVYIHRLRKKLEDFYQKAGAQEPHRLILPRSEYCLKLEPHKHPEVVVDNSVVISPLKIALVIAFVVMLNLLAWVVLYSSDDAQATPALPLNTLWSEFNKSDRPIAVIVGDYYIFGEFGYSPDDASSSRLVRDFRVNSAKDLEELTRQEPELFNHSRDIDLTYAPLSVAYALSEIIPLIQQTGRDYQVFPSSKVYPSMLKNADVVYLGLVSGMGFLEPLVFTDADYSPGSSYDEMINIQSGKRYFSNEASRHSDGEDFVDYGYVSFSRSDIGLLIAITGLRDAGLRRTAELMASPQLHAVFDDLANQDHIETLFKIQGVRNASIREKIVLLDHDSVE